ncbi:hypothetical protein LF1_37660 [Rubripirellula obstinata]|uniref:Ice-binding protein C-terminal domain-containing protein n=1 Tax=Rubripirellula obstinata TaxID=406547 RepID=A0A5B1CNR0_9BACT|nr:choice-of-anchor M domain-containing protein [Rubripirellula obstinata]KAA1261220.1 hypothetical protein LF1_37660 [Rubripirellula obstinata]
MRNLFTKSIHLCCFAALSLLASNASAAVTEWFEEHGDIGIGYEGGNELELHYHFEDGVNGSDPGSDLELEPNQAYIRVADNAFRTNSLGGQNYWVLPESNSNGSMTGAEDLGLPFVGLAAEELEASDFTSDITLTLTDFNGPGDFALWREGSVPGDETVFMQTNGGTISADTFSLMVGEHGHANFGFTQEGVYEIELTASGNLAGGGTATDTETFRFAVGSATAIPEPTSFAMLASLGAFAGLARRRRS